MVDCVFHDTFSEGTYPWALYLQGRFHQWFFLKKALHGNSEIMRYVVLLSDMIVQCPLTRYFWLLHLKCGLCSHLPPSGHTQVLRKQLPSSHRCSCTWRHHISDSNIKKWTCSFLLLPEILQFLNDFRLNSNVPELHGRVPTGAGWAVKLLCPRSL